MFTLSFEVDCVLCLLVERTNECKKLAHKREKERGRAGWARVESMLQGETMSQGYRRILWRQQRHKRRIALRSIRDGDRHAKNEVGSYMARGVI